MDQGKALVSWFESESAQGVAAGAGEMKRIKEWFRDGMNEGVGDDAKLKGEAPSLSQPPAPLRSWRCRPREFSVFFCTPG